MQREGRRDSWEEDIKERSAVERVRKLAEEDAVVLFTKSECCISVAAKALLSTLGAHPTIHQLDKEEEGEEMEGALLTMLAAHPAVPAIFIGGKLVGGMEELMSCHITGFLLPLLKEAGALWL
ncbi:hypothetical protein SUGI_0219620 [Cryptomeria japonica]|uniref:putative glutaredoxin-C14 n=1 Tax=Cryptomeria japonica TaxID=3369 RepID=UPI002408EE91|nr:putative glutaredoxin-C14 [Cryptomeria japonica]GLJ13760.1 hypothetical protein SUGI_0219620 [Cryptomeria japonica]